MRNEAWPRAAVGLEEETQPVELAGVAQQGVEADDIVLTDGAFGGIPVGEDRLAQRCRASRSITGCVRSISTGGLEATGRFDSGAESFLSINPAGASGQTGLS
jgi:hypothetical protein